MKILISILLSLLVCQNCFSQKPDSIDMKCERIWTLYKTKFRNDTYRFVIVNFTLTNRSGQTQEFMSWDGWHTNILPRESDVIFINGIYAAHERQMIKAHSNDNCILIFAINEKYYREKDKRISFDFVWISKQEYKARFNKELKIEKQRRLKLLREHKESPLPGEDYESMRFKMLRQIDGWYKRKLFFKEKIEFRKDLLNCELKL